MESIYQQLRHHFLHRPGWVECAVGRHVHVVEGPSPGGHLESGDKTLYGKLSADLTGTSIHRGTNPSSVQLLEAILFLGFSLSDRPGEFTTRKNKCLENISLRLLYCHKSSFFFKRYNFQKVASIRVHYTPLTKV